LVPPNEKPKENKGSDFFSFFYSSTVGCFEVNGLVSNEKVGRFSYPTLLRLLLRVLKNVFSTVNMFPSSSPTIKTSIRQLCQIELRILKFFFAPFSTALVQSTLKRC